MNDKTKEKIATFMSVIMQSALTGPYKTDEELKKYFDTVWKSRVPEPSLKVILDEAYEKGDTYEFYTKFYLDKNANMEKAQ